jgi:CDP-paratose 2-epimerase
MRSLITGGAGFVGSNLAMHLKQKGHEVVVFDNLVRRGSELNLKDFEFRDIEFIHGDIRNAEDLNKLSGKFDYVFETAAQPSACAGYANPIFDITNNYIGLLNVLEYVRKTGSKMIFWSTNKVYSGEAINIIPRKELNTRYEYSNKGSGISEQFDIDGGSHSIYGLSKVCADLTCQEWASSFDIPIIINRFSCLAGPRQFGKSEQGWVAWFVIAAVLGLPVTLFGFQGKQVRDVLFIPDIMNLIDKELGFLPKSRGEVFNIGGGQSVNTSLVECISIIEEITNKKIQVSYDKKQRTADQCVYISNIDKAKAFLKWEPKITLEDGIWDIYDWVGKNKETLKGLYV